MNFARLAGIAVMMTLAACASSHADNDGWSLLGERTVNHRVDHDEIRITARDGDFRRIALRVEGAPVEFYSVVVHYRNGGEQRVEMRDEIRAGGQTRAIDLQGRERVIERVSFNYHTDDRGDGRAVVQLWGLG
jgi:hypothetical protein